MNLKKLFWGIAALLPFAATGASAAETSAENVSAVLSLKVPGNGAKDYPLEYQHLKDGMYAGVPSGSVPVTVNRQVTDTESGQRITVTLIARENVYFNYGEQIRTGFRHDDCQFYMPGFWYRRNLRSPKEAPSFYTSDSWLVRDDRLSAPLTAVFNEKEGKSVSIVHLLSGDCATDAFTAGQEGEVILSGNTSVGYTGFLNKDGETLLAYGFPYQEAPKSYIRKLTLAPSVKAYQLLRKGEAATLVWELSERKADDFSECVQHTWEYCYDTFRPKPVQTAYTPEYVKEVLSNYFTESYVSGKLNYYASPDMRVTTCESPEKAEVGFVGRTLLNAFNALEYGEQQHPRMTEQARSIFDSYLKNGFSEAGFFNEVMMTKSSLADSVHSIRRQSEGVYAVLYYLDYEKRKGRKHPEWENRIRKMLDMFLKLQEEDGSFPRKFLDDFSAVDPTGGSTSSATLPLVMGYKYFNDKRYLESARRTADYLDKGIISKADYFSSTLDANCEDKEASLYASTALYYLALASKGEEKAHYTALARKAAYFALSWYYVWDVPFAPGQMLGDIGLKTRGWGNVSVENNHIDVFIFDFADVLRWLSEECGEPRFAEFAEVISTSMRQLLPREGFLCGVGRPGYYPEVVQHTRWDYGKGGKGYYNDIFAPGWTVASLWELLSPGRAERFLQK